MDKKCDDDASVFSAALIWKKHKLDAIIQNLEKKNNAAAVVLAEKEYPKRPTVYLLLPYLTFSSTIAKFLRHWQHFSYTHLPSSHLLAQSRKFSDGILRRGIR